MSYEGLIDSHAHLSYIHEGLDEMILRAQQSDIKRLST